MTIMTLIVARLWDLIKHLVLPDNRRCVFVLTTANISANAVTTITLIQRRNVLIPEPSVPTPAAESSNVTVTHPFTPTPVALPPKSLRTNVWMMPARIMPSVTVPLITSLVLAAICKVSGQVVTAMARWCMRLANASPATNMFVKNLDQHPPMITA